LLTNHKFAELTNHITPVVEVRHDFAEVRHDFAEVRHYVH
jgi:hypothetical protein